MSADVVEGEYVVRSADDLRELARCSGRENYTYLLRRPDMIDCFGGIGTPFYVGVGRGLRLFSHVNEAVRSSGTSKKLSAIREIIESGGEVIHCIDRFHDAEPWDREEELIRSIGQIKHGTGPLTNEQDYAPSRKVGGVEVRKYADEHRDETNNIPSKFKLGDVRLSAGPNEPKSRESVFGKIYTVLEAHPGVTGAELVPLLMRINFTDNKSAYTQSGEVCAAWLCGYIEGGFFRRDRLHIRRFEPSDSDV